MTSTWKKNRTEFFCVLATAVLLLSLTCPAWSQLPTPPEEARETSDRPGYPRIEVYSEIDKVGSGSRSHTWTDSDSRTVHGAKGDHWPHILRTSYQISKQDYDRLLGTMLRFHPGFDQEKPDITLADYFRAASDRDRTPLYRLLPSSLNSVRRKKNLDKNVEDHNTVVLYQCNHPDRIVLVRHDEDTWFLNDAYYTDSGQLLTFMVGGQDEIVAEGSFADFLRLSPLFQGKLTEGFPNLRIPGEQPTIPLDDVVLAASLSPGSPGSSSYHCKIAGDGSLMMSGLKTRRKVDLQGLTSLLLQADRLNWENFGRREPKPFVHDGQTARVGFWYRGRFKTVEEDDPAISPSHREFIDQLKLFLSEQS